MDEKGLKFFWNKLLCITVAVASAMATAIQAIVFINSIDGGFFALYNVALSVAISSIMCVLVGFTVFFCLTDREIFYKTGLLVLVTVCLFVTGLFVLYVSGFLDRVDSVEDLREFISSYGGLSVLLFLFVQILQVTVIPIPGVVTIGAGVLLFGPFWGAVLSFVGIMLGSIIAFYIGRVLGSKAVRWLVGKENLEKGLKLVKGKDKVVLSFMFLFPFFPDDLLCFVSGLSSMSAKFYLVMITVTRTVSVFTTAYSVNGSLIPYNTWWGVLIWAVLIVGCLLLVRIVYKNSEKLEKFFKRRKK